MNMICSICNDQFVQSDDIFCTLCGHVFHLYCLQPWLKRSESCPQCREKVTSDKIHRLYFNFSNNDVVEIQGPSVQDKIDSLKFQILLKEKDIQFQSSKNVTYKKQNVLLKQEVRKLELEINKKNAAIHALKEQVKYFKEHCSIIDKLKEDNVTLKNKLQDLRPVQVLLNGPLSDVRKIIGKIRDPDILIKYVSMMKMELSESFNKCKQLRMTIKKLKEELSKDSTNLDTSNKQTSRTDLEVKLAISESTNVALQKQLDELKEVVGINENFNSESSFQSTESKDTTSTEIEVQVLKKNNSKAISTVSASKHAPKRHIEKMSACSTKHIFDREIDTRHSNVDLTNSSGDSPVFSKKIKLSTNSIRYNLDESGILKQRKMNTKSQVSGNQNNSSTIDLT